MGFFSRRRKRESAIPESGVTQQAALGSFANPDGQPVVGQQVGGGAPDLGSINAMDGLQALTQIGPMIQQAIASGNVQITQGEPAVLDMRGTGLREEIMEIMNQHGIDPAKGVQPGADASGYMEMQQQIMAALAKHGINAGGAGTPINFQPGQMPPGWEGGESK